MTPIVRGHFVPEIENAGRVKRIFDVLLWGSHWSKRNAIDLDQIEVLREYLRRMTPGFCGIRLLVPSSHPKTIEMLKELGCRTALVEIVQPDSTIAACVGNEELATATQTAIGCDADTLVVTNEEWFPYFEEL